ncbi:MAG: NAD(P)/FAD-dependent oxidoreductase [bacterium]
MKPRLMKTVFLLALSCSLFLAACEKEQGPYDFDAVIVGAGGGGLGAGAALAKNGLKVAVFEQHDKVGGFMTAFERDDFTFEVSLHVMANVTEGAAFYRVLQDLDVLRRVEFVKVDPLWRCVFPDMTLDVPADREAFRKLLYDRFPREHDGIDAYFRTTEAVYDEVLLLGGLSGKSLLARLPSYALFPLRFPTFYKYRNATLERVLDDTASDPRLRGVFAQLWGYLGLPPSRASGPYYAMMWHGLHKEGAFYPKGSSQAVSNAMAAVIQENGGQIFLDTRIDKILVEGAKAVGVRTAKGQEFRSRFVVSNASALQTYLRLVGKEHLKPAFTDKLEHMEISCSLLIVYLGLDLDLAKTDLKDLHEVFINSGYDFEQDYRNLQAGNLDDPHIVMGLYSNIDPSCAPPGKSVVSLVTVMPYDYRNNWRPGDKYDDYVKLKEEAAWKLIRRAEAVLPGIGDHIEVMEVGTPRTIERYTLHDRGAVYGFALTPEQSFRNRLAQKGPIRNLYLAGGWTFPGNGQSTAIMSGYLAAREILERARP